jgi:hypothetical protein
MSQRVRASVRPACPGCPLARSLSGVGQGRSYLQAANPRPGVSCQPSCRCPGSMQMHAKEPHRSGGVPASHAACSKGSSATGGRMRRSRLARTPEAALLISAQRPAGVSAEGPVGPNEARRERGRDYTKEGNLHLSPFSLRTLNARVILAASDVWPPPAAHPHRLPTTAPLCPHAGRAVRKSRAADPLRMRHRKPDRFSDAHIASQTLPATVCGASPHATSSDTARSAGRSPGRTLSLPEEDSGPGAIRDPRESVKGMRSTCRGEPAG